MHHRIGRVAIQSSTAVATQFCRQLKTEGFNPIISYPKKTRLITKAKIKRDCVDFNIIAQLLRMDWASLQYVPDEKTKELREKWFAEELFR